MSAAAVKPVPDEGGWFLSKDEMLAIRSRQYQYNAWSTTLLDPYMQPFWRTVVSYIPKSVAPTTLSVCGLSCNIVVTSITVYFAPTLTEILPSWVGLMNALSIFLYQTFDGIDGKQCSRTQESELEEYTDHAADSLSVMLNAVLLAAAMRLGNSPMELSANLLLALSAFFAAHWAGQRTQSLVFGHIDVTEAQWSMIGIHIASAFGGSSVWDYHIAEVPALTIKAATCSASAAVLLFATVASLSVALGMQETPLESHGIRIPRKPLSLWPLVSYGIMLAGAIVCIRNGLLTSLTVPTMLVVGLAIGKAGTQLVFQKLTGRERPMMDISVVAPLVLSSVPRYFGFASDVLCVAAWTLVGLQVADVVVFHHLATEDLKNARSCHRFSVVDTADTAKLVSTGFYVAGDNVKEVQKAWKELEATAPCAPAA